MFVAKMRIAVVFRLRCLALVCRRCSLYYWWYTPCTRTCTRSWLIFEVIVDSTWFLLGQSAMLFFWRLIVGVSVGLEVWWVTLIWVQQFLHHSQNDSSKPARLIFTVFLCLRGRSADSSSLASLSKTPSIQYACWASRRWQLWRTRPRYPFHILISPRSSKSSSSSSSDEYVGLTLATPDLPIVKFSVLSS